MANLQTHNHSAVASRLLTLNSALLLAGDDKEILAALRLCIGKEADLYLFRLRLEGVSPIGATLSAALHNTLNDEELPVRQQFSPDDLPFIAAPETHSPVWTDGDLVDWPDFIDGQSFTIIKLYRHSSAGLLFFAFVLIAWPTAYIPTLEDYYVYMMASYVASAIITSHQNVSIKLLKISSEMLLSSTEHQILESLSVCADSATDVHLLYVDHDADGKPRGATLVESWMHDGIEKPGLVHRQFMAGEIPLLHILNETPQPAWFADDLGQQLLPACFENIHGVAAVKLYETTGQRQWNAVILFLWNMVHPLTDDEKYVFTAISQPTSALVTSYRRHQEAQQHLTRLRELDRLKDDFLYSMSHELRTPLNGIISVADLLLSGLEGKMPPIVEKSARIIQESGEHLLMLVNEILDFAKIQASGIQFYPEPVNIGDLFTETIQTVNVSQNRTINVNARSDLPPVYADPTRLRQILINLLSNAIKFAEQGVIEIGARLEGQTLIFYVRDEGVGIKLADQQTIFEPFRQLNPALTRKHGGTGLGLPITKRLVELQGGRIWVSSKPGHGATFYFSVPIAQDQPIGSMP